MLNHKVSHMPTEADAHKRIDYLWITGLIGSVGIILLFGLLLFSSIEIFADNEFFSGDADFLTPAILLLVSSCWVWLQLSSWRWQVRVRLLKPVTVSDYSLQEIDGKKRLPSGTDEEIASQELRKYEAPSWLRLGANTLISIGLAGTFLGLTIGLFNALPHLQRNQEPTSVSADDTTPENTEADNVELAIDELLEGAKLAFLKSLAGIFLALLWSFRYLEVQNSEEAIYQKLLHQIRERYPPASPEEILLHANRQLTSGLDKLLQAQQQATVDQGLSSRRLAEEFKEASTQSSHVLAEELKRLVARADHLVVGVGQIQKNQVSVISLVRDEMKAVRGQDDASLTSVTNSLQDVQDTIVDLGESLPEKIGSHAGTQVGRTLQPDLAGLKDVLQALGTTGKNAIGDALQSSMGDEVTVLRQALLQVTEAMAQLPAKLAEGGQEAANTLSKASHRGAAELTTAAGDVAKQTRAAGNSIEELKTLLAQTGVLIHELNVGSESLRKSFEAATAPLQTLPESLESARSGLEDAGTKAREAASHFDKAGQSASASLTSAASALSKSANEASSSIASASGEFSRSAHTSAQTISKAAASLSTSTQTAGENLTKQIASAGSGLTEQIVQAGSGLNTQLEQAGSGLNAQLERAGLGLSEQIVKAGQSTSTSLTNSAVSLSNSANEVSSSMAKASEDFSRSANASARSISEAATSLSSSTQAAGENLNEQIGKVGSGLAEQLKQAGSALGQDASVAGTALTAAAERTGELMQSGGQTLSQHLDNVGDLFKQDIATQLVGIRDTLKVQRDAQQRSLEAWQTERTAIEAREHASREQTQEMSDKTTALMNAVDTLRQSCSDTAQALTEVATQQQGGADQAIQDLLQAVSAFSTALESNQETIRDAGLKSVATTEQVTVAAARQVAQALEEGASNLTTAMAEGKELSELVSSHAVVLKAGLIEAQKTANHLQQQGQTLSQSGAQLRQELQRVTDPLEALRDSFEGVAPAVESATQAMEEERLALSGLGESLREQAVLISEGERTLKTRATELQRLHEVLGSQWNGHVKRLTDAHNQVKASWQAAMHAADSSTEQNAQKLANYASRVEKALGINDRVTGLQSGLEEVADTLSELAPILSRLNDQLDQVASSSDTSSNNNNNSSGRGRT
jgi:DNA repair exonuclease SbcCD ATPase subunit